jgi:tetratricopeptide (TPR) repeat protein
MILKTICKAVLVIGLFSILACGPETIFIRQGLDTPSHHVDNGYKLMAYGKHEAALREFDRAKELDPNYAPAYVGLGIVYGMQGELEKGRSYMTQAEKLAQDEDQRQEVKLGFERLDYIEKEQ